MAWRGVAECGEVRPGRAWQARTAARLGGARQGLAGCGEAWRGRQGKMARQGEARAAHGEAWQGRLGLGLAGRGGAQHGSAWPSKAWRVRARRKENIKMVWTKEERIALSEHLTKIAARSDGMLTPEAVFEDARDDTSPLHHYFEWDVAKAAYRHWIERARDLIRTVHVVIEHTDVNINVPQWIRDPDLAHSQAGYVTVQVLQNDPERAARALANECGAATALLSRAVGLAKALRLHRQLDAIVEQITTLAGTAERRAKAAQRRRARAH